jgi:hypothetical protein
VTTTDDPWSGLSPPSNVTRANAKPVGGDARWNFYWMLDSERHRLLGLRHSKGLAPHGQLPRLKGVGVEVAAFEDDVDILIFKLLDSAHKEVFLRLCSDIIATASEAADEEKAVAAAINRTWRWHYLLKGGSDERLSPEEQKGLMGELRVLQEHVALAIPIAKALEMWTGPFGAPKDFEIGTVAVEAKAHRAGARPMVSISSEYQLDTGDFTQVFLHVINLTRPAPADDGLSITDVVSQVRSYVERTDASALDALEVRLMAAGYRDADDYSDSLWMETGSQLYRVTDTFPRIPSNGLIFGVERVRYDIALNACEAFAVADAELDDAISGEAPDPSTQ